MSGHAKKLSDLGIVIPNQLGIHRVLQSLPPSYKNFVMNYNMQNMNKELPEHFSMLKSAEVEIQKEHQVLMVNWNPGLRWLGHGRLSHGLGRLQHAISGLVHLSPGRLQELVILAGEGSGKIIRVPKSTRTSNPADHGTL
ncbi:hypothetical protein QYE76_028070 [Lolium multiflorum]|uniref:Uncharacterized protein n=1 Tax=Lolium multiflorum TaxID=4521 RepID=A0AAD8VE73_LOLMU|nr:hypothetical protein QYE76_028070 [Lolium multiflorum]